MKIGKKKMTLGCINDLFHLGILQCQNMKAYSASLKTKHFILDGQ